MKKTGTIKPYLLAAAALTIGAGGYLGITARQAHLATEWESQHREIVGTVLAESYQNTLVPKPAFNGVVSYSNETVRLDSKYTLKVETDDGKIIGVSVIDSKPYGTVTKESLDALIGKGTRISFPRGNMQTRNFFSVPASRVPNYDRLETSFGEDTRVGTKRAHRIKVLD